MVFSKYSGAENRFLIALESNLDLLTAQRTKEISNTHGVDGALLVKPISENNFEWRFYNSDGSSAEMCGNAARCVAHFLAGKGLLKTRVNLKTLAGKIELVRLPAGQLRVIMPAPENPKTIILKHQGQELSGAFILAGVPHLVLDFPGAYRMTKEEARGLRFHPQLHPHGANITLVRKMASSRAMVRTYERGVEDFTKACGTGAIAAATVLHGQEPVPKIEIQMPGGTLLVEFASRKVILSGPTELEAEVEIKL